jgi:hypothetical protein
MKRNIAICLIVFVAISMLASLVLVQPASADPVPINTGGYHLVPVRWHLAGEASGSGYYLRMPGSPALRGNGCCCTHLPCVVKP